MTNWKEMPAWQHLQKYRPLLYELVVRDLKVKYRRSFLEIGRASCRERV